MSLQVSVPTGITIEIDAHGCIYMFKTYMVCMSGTPPDYIKECKQKNLLQSTDVVDETKSCPGLITEEKNVEEENWRCILPSGVVIRVMKKGGLVV